MIKLEPQLSRVRFDISGYIEVDSDRNPNEYRKALERWLNDSIKNSFGPEDDVTVDLVVAVDYIE